MKKPDITTLKMKLNFMKGHLKNPKDFSALVKQVAFSARDFSAITDSAGHLLLALPKNATKEQKRQYDEALEKIKNRDIAKKQIKKLKGVLEKLPLDTQARLARDVERDDPAFPFICPTGKKFALVPPMLKQCAGALSNIRYEETALERLFLMRLKEVFVTSTGEPVKYNHGEGTSGCIFIKFCDVAYWHAGKSLSVATVRDRVREHVWQTIPLCADNQTGMQYHPKSSKNKGF
jgi:hypothetical protein